MPLRRGRIVAAVLWLAAVCLPFNAGAAEPVVGAPTDCAGSSWPSSVAVHLDMVRSGLQAPALTTVGALASLAPPADQDTAIPVVWRFDANLVQTQVASDGTIELSFADLDNPGQTLTGAVLAPECLSTPDSLIATQLAGARNALYAACSYPIPTTPRACAARVSVVGVGVFNFRQSGSGLELRPVLGLQPAAGGGSGKSLSGVGSQDSLAFQLDTAQYTIAWSASTAGTDPVNFAGFVKPVDPTSPGWVFVANAIVRPGETQSGSVQSPPMAGGAYYLSAIGDASWSVTIAPVPTPSPTAVAPLPLVTAPAQPRVAPAAPTLVQRAPVPVQPLPTPRPRPTPRPWPTRPVPTPITPRP